MERICHMRTPIFLIPVSFVMTSVSTEAQIQDRVYPIPELADEMRAKIDVTDGSIEDWVEILGEPSLTPLDFQTAPWASEYDPSSLDYRIWVAWHHADDQLFVGMELVDDFVNERFYDRSDRGGLAGADLSIAMGVDGDRSGGSLLIDNATGLTYPMEQAQWYEAFPGTYDNDNNLLLRQVSPHTDWVHKPPYADGGGAVIDSEPSFGVVEFFVTPFDRLIWDDQDQSMVSNLFSGKTIGFSIQIVDVDDANEFESMHGLFGIEDGWEQGGFNDSDLWAGGILIEAGGTEDSAVTGVSWARIKASLSE